MRDNVLRGIALLDSRIPQWRNYINWNILDMSYESKCIVGQLLRNPDTKAEISDINHFKSFNGFMCKSDSNDNCKCSELTALWKELAHV